MVAELLYRHFVTILLIVSFSLNLAFWRQVDKTQTKYMWLAVLCAALLIVVDVLDKAMVGNPDLTFAGIAVSVVGHSLRCIAPLCVLLAIAHESPRHNLLWIPAASR